MMPRASVAFPRSTLFEKHRYHFRANRSVTNGGMMPSMRVRSVMDPFYIFDPTSYQFFITSLLHGLSNRCQSFPLMLRNFKLQTRQIASLTIDFDIFETPSSRSLKIMEISPSLNPAFHALKCNSI